MKRSHCVKRTGIFLFIFLFFASFAFAQGSGGEQILSFDSHVSVHKDASLLVIETIQVKSNGQEIRRGIYRDFPTRYSDLYGNNYVVGFHVVSVERDGKSEPYRTENRYNGKRIYIGNPDYSLPPGVYTYRIAYETTRQLGFFKDHDELYWNVTGNAWIFPVVTASATVELPQDAGQKVITVSGFTGLQGAREKAFEAFKKEDGKLVFLTTRLLNPYEGFTIIASWPKGYVQEPTSAMKFQYFLDDNEGIIYAMFCLLALAGYYILTWFLVGRDPGKGTIIALFHPPEGFSPASMRYLWKMDYDHKAFTAAVIDMAVKGFLKIEENAQKVLNIELAKVYVLKRIGGDGSSLSGEEKAVADKLFEGSRGEIPLKKENHQIIQQAIAELKSALAAKLERIYFLGNKGYFALGVFLSFLIFVFTFGLLNASMIGFLWAAVVCVATVVFNVVFYRLLKAPTVQGRKVMDQIEGFKMFLEATEKDRLNFFNPPQRTPELFEKYLPYALALDVEQKWAEQFNEVFERLSQRGDHYHPHWYVGPSWNAFGRGGFSQSLGGALSSAIAASSTPPGSSSGGGGGGGHSGGGGGGGGGGGW